jgi:hypothetical protein
MKFECQSCLLQFDAVGAGPESKCPRCGSTNVKGAGGDASIPASSSGPVGGQPAIAATIAQPMVAPIGASAIGSSQPAPFNPMGAPQAAPPSPYGAPPSPYGAPPSPYGAPQQAAPPNPYAAPQQAAPYGAPPNPYAAPQQAPYGAAPNPYAAQQQAPYGAPPNPYAQPQQAPMGGAFGAPMGGGFGAAPMGMVAVSPYGNPQLDAEQRKATVLGIIAVLTIWPCAIGSFVQLNASKQAAQMGDFNTAFAKAKSAQMWGWASMAIMGGFIALGCLAGLAGGM